jgi:hypothetical protein
MAAGIPVACSNCTSLPEVAAEAALLFNPRIPTQIAQALITLCSDELLREHLIATGKVRASLFSDASKMAKEYWSLFLEALETQQENRLTGAYDDGWAGSKLHIQVKPDNNHQCLEMDFFAPDWLPLSKIRIKTSQKGAKQSESLVIRPGTHQTLSLPLGPRGAHYEISLSPTFMPKKTELSKDDKRELSLMIRRCLIKKENGESIELIPEKNLA